MNKQFTENRFHERIDAELQALKGDPSLAEKVFLLAEDRQTLPTREKLPLLRYATVLLSVVLLLSAILLLARYKGDDTDHLALSDAKEQNNLFDNTVALKSYAYCPVCERKTQWMEDCAGNVKALTAEGESSAAFMHSCRVCINCGNRYVYNTLHQHGAAEDGAVTGKCPYWLSQQAVLDRYPEIVEKALEESRKQYQPAYREAYCEACGKATRWKEVCGEDAALYLSHVNHSDGAQDCKLTIVYAKTRLECSGCGATAETDDVHLHLIKHNTEQARYPAQRDDRCPILSGT